jgi:hypothetical protein
MRIARSPSMTATVFRALVAAATVTAGSFAACSRPASQSSAIRPQLGESTAPGPSDPTVSPPDAPGVTELSVPFQGARHVAPGPAPTPSATMPGGDGPAAQNPTGAVGPNGLTSDNGPAPPPGPATGSPGATPPSPSGQGPGTGDTPSAPAPTTAPTTPTPPGSATPARPTATPPIPSQGTMPAPGGAAGTTGRSPSSGSPGTSGPPPSTPGARQR